jgi:Predicted dehydrogenases and related proteins
MKKTKIGIIGAGGMAKYHIAGFTRAGAEIVAIADRNIEKAQVCANEYGVPHAFASFQEMIGQCPDLTAVSVILPNSLHATAALEALEKGLHVYCEKPPAINATEMDRILKASEKNSRVLMFDFNNRARPESRAMMEYIRQGSVGAINSAQATWIRRNGIPGFGGWFTTRSLSGGGAVIDLLHMIDLSLYFMDYPEPEHVLARTYNDFMDNRAFKGPWGISDSANGTTDVESACQAMVTFKSGQSLLVRNSWAEMNEREVVSAVFQGTRAGGKVERLFDRDGIDETSVDTCKLFTEENGFQVNRDIIVPKDETMGRVESAANFVEAIEGRAKPLNTPGEALTLMKIIDGIYASAASGKPESV